MRCSCCGCCPDRLRRLCFFRIQHRCFCFHHRFFRCGERSRHPERQRCYRRFYFHENVIAALTEGFAEVEPGVTVSYDPTGSGAGITGATDKTLDIGLSSRALKDDEKNDVDGTTVLWTASPSSSTRTARSRT